MGPSKPARNPWRHLAPSRTFPSVQPGSVPSPIRRPPSRHPALGFRARRVLALLAALAGCSGSTDPAGPEILGTFQLTAVNGGPLPAVYYHAEVEGRVIQYRVHDGRIEFRTRHRIYDIRTLDFLDPRPDTLIAGYSSAGTQLLFTRQATPAHAAHTDTGTIDGDVLTMRIRHLAGRPNAYATFTYVRQP